MDDFNYSDDKNNISKPPFLSDSLSIESMVWIRKVRSLCENNKVKFFLASPPVPKNMKIETSNWIIIKRQIVGTDLKELFNNYFNSIIYLDNKYLKDKIHWKYDYITKHRKELLKTIKNRLIE